MPSSSHSSQNSPRYADLSLDDRRQDITRIDGTIGWTPLVQLQRLPGDNPVQVWAKLEGNNPAGSVKDRPAYHMIAQAERRGELQPGMRLIEATSGNTGIALALVAAMRGYPITLIMPANATQERKDAMRAYGATLIEVSQAEGMEGARDLALQMQAAGDGIVLNQFGNPDNADAHFLTTGPEIWQQTQGRVTHFVSSMGTTGTIMGVSRYLKSQNPAIQIIGLQPAPGAQIPGIRRWPEAYLPTIFEPDRVDQVMDIDQPNAEAMMRQLARDEGIFAGVSSGGSVWAALQIAEQIRDTQPNAVIVCIVCDRGDRYLSTGLFGHMG